MGLFNTCFRTRVKYMFKLTTYPENFKSYKIYYMLIEKNIIHKLYKNGSLL